MPLSYTFVVSGVIALATAVYAALRIERDPAAPVHDEPSVRANAESSSALALVYRIKTSCFATFAYGYF